MEVCVGRHRNADMTSGARTQAEPEHLGRGMATPPTFGLPGTVGGGALPAVYLRAAASTRMSACATAGLLGSKQITSFPMRTVASSSRSMAGISRPVGTG